MTNIAAVGKKKSVRRSKRGMLLRNSVALVALSLFAAPLLPQAALADCSTAGSTLTCSGMDDTGGTISASGVPPSPVVVNIQSGALVTNTDDDNDPAIEITATGSGAEVDFNMLSPDSSIVAGSNEYAVEVDVTSTSGTSSSTFDVNGIVQSTEQDAFNIELENGSITFNVGDTGVIRGDNEGIDISSGSSSSSRTVSVDLDIEEGGQVRGSDGNAIDVSVSSIGIPFVSPSAGNATANVKFESDGRITAGNNGLNVTATAFDFNGATRTATADVSGTNGKTGVIDVGGDGIAVSVIGEAADVTFDMSNDGRMFAGDDGVDVNVVAGPANGSMKFVNNGQIGSLLDPTGDNGVNFFVLGASGSVSAEVQNTKGATIFSKGDGIGIAITGGVDGPVKVVNDGAINAGGTGIQVTSNGQVDIGGADGTINGVSGGINVITTDGDVNIIDPGRVTATNGSAIVGATLNGNTTITTNKAVSATNGNGVYGASVNGDTNVTTNDKVSVTNGTYGAAANAVNGNATLTINGGIDPPSIGGSAAAVNGNATIIVNNDPDFDVDAIDVGLFGANVGTGVVSITNNGETIDSDGAGVIAAKLGEGVVGGDSITIKNLGGRIEAGTGPGIAVTAADPDSILDPPNAIVNNVWIENNKGGYITGAGNLLALPPTSSVGVITDGALALLNDNASTITNANGAGGLALGVVAGHGVNITNDNGSDIIGAATIGSTAGSVYIKNDHGSSWTSEGVSIIGALGTDQDVTLDNLNGSQVDVTNGLLAMAADRDVTINNIWGYDGWGYPVRSSIDFNGSSANLMIAGRDARITNDGSDITMGDFDPGVSGNLMFAGRDAEIINKNGASFTMTSLVNGNYMNADRDARIVNEENSTFSMSGINGNVLVANRDAVIKNSKGSTFSMTGLNGTYLDADRDALIINEKGSDITLTGLNGTALVAGRDAQIDNTMGSSFTLNGLSGTYLNAGRDARITNDKGSDFTMTGLSGTALFAGRDAEIINSEGGDFLMEGLTGTYLNAERDARIVNEKGGDFTMRGITGTVLVADDDAEIINTRGGELRIEGLNGAVMIADADNNNIGRALIENSDGSVMTFAGVTGGQIVAGSEIAFINDASSEMNFIGLNGFLIEPGVNSFFDNDGFVFVDGATGFAGLDNFNNNNIVSMQEGEVDDVLALGGNYNANSELWIDAELTHGGLADLLLVGGNVTGTTLVSVNDLDGGPGQYDPEGVLFAVVAGSTDVSNFTTGGGIDKGLFRYDTYLRVDDPALSAGADGWYLASTLDGEAYEFPGIMSGAQALWNTSTGTWLDRTADLRVALGDGAIDPNCAKDCLPEIGNVTPGVWMKALAGTQSRDSDNRSAPPPGMLGDSYGYDNGFDQNFWGFLIGADAGKEWTTASGHNAAWLAGIMGGYLGSQLGFNDSNTDVDYEAFTLGVYTTYLNGGFFIDGTLKADLGTVDYDSDLGGGFSESTSSDFTSIGGLVDMGYRFDVSSGVFIEPMATLSYVNTSIDDMDVLGTNVAYDDGESLQGRLGGRIGATIEGDSMKSELFLEGSVWNEFMGDYDARLGSNGYDVKTDLDTGGVYGEVGVGANVFGDAGWNGFLTGAVQFGDSDFLGYSGNLGLRYSW